MNAEGQLRAPTYRAAGRRSPSRSGIWPPPSSSRASPASRAGRQLYPSISSMRQVARWTVGSSSTTSMTRTRPRMYSRGSRVNRHFGSPAVCNVGAGPPTCCSTPLTCPNLPSIIRVCLGSASLADVAQLAEHLFCKQAVRGSIPLVSSAHAEARAAHAEGQCRHPNRCGTPLLSSAGFCLR